MQHTTMDQINYNGLSDDDDDIKSAATQLACGMLKLDDYQPIRELERIRSESNQALETTQFSTSREKELAETVQRNTNGWIDTAKDTLYIAVNFAGLGKENFELNVYLILITSKYVCANYSNQWVNAR